MDGVQNEKFYYGSSEKSPFKGGMKNQYIVDELPKKWGLDSYQKKRE